MNRTSGSLNIRKGLVSTTATKLFILLPVAFSRLILVPFSRVDSACACRRRIIGEKVSIFHKLGMDEICPSIEHTGQ